MVPIYFHYSEYNILMTFFPDSAYINKQEIQTRFIFILKPIMNEKFFLRNIWEIFYFPSLKYIEVRIFFCYIFLTQHILMINNNKKA